MISFKQSNKPLAIIKGGDNDGEFIYYHPEILAENQPKHKPSSYLSGEMFKKNRKNLKQRDIYKIYEAIDNDGDFSDDDEEIVEYYQKAKHEYKNKSPREIKIYDGVFQAIPDIEEGQRQAILISGPSGIGKSTWMSKYIKEYHADFPNNKIYFFSKKEEDPEIDKYKYIIRVLLDEEFLEGEPLDCKDLSNSLCCFDDIENLSDKKLREVVYKLKDNLLETGRSENIYLCITAHLAMNHKDTKITNNESTAFVFFKGGNVYHTKRYLKEYMGIGPKKIQELLDQPSRWVYINKFPMYCLTENKCFLL